jgi:DNA-binding CsgD family transcriptional regulator
VPIDPIGLAHDASTAPEFERTVLEHLKRAVGMDAAFFASCDGPPTTLVLDAARLGQALAEGGGYDLEMRAVKRRALDARGVAIDTEVLGERAVRASRYHRDFAAPIGGRHTLMAYLRLRGSITGGLMLGRCGGGFGERDVSMVEALLPALSIARASFGQGPSASVAALSSRERDVLEYLCLGYTNREIALACGTSPNTVRNQLGSVFGKLGASTRAEAVSLAQGGGGGVARWYDRTIAPRGAGR